MARAQLNGIRINIPNMYRYYKLGVAAVAVECIHDFLCSILIASNHAISDLYSTIGLYKKGYFQ